MSRFWVAFGKWRTLSRWTRGCSQGRGGLCPVPLVSPAVPPGLAHKYPFPVPCLAPVRGHTQRDPQAQQMLPCVRRSLLRSESALQAAQEAFADLAALKMLGPGLADAGWLGWDGMPLISRHNFWLWGRVGGRTAGVSRLPLTVCFV